MRNVGKHIISTLLLMQFLLLSGCIHTYPDGDGVDPTLVQIGLEVSIDLSWQPQEVSLTKAESSTYDGGYRLIVEFTRNGNTHGRCEHYLTAEEYREGNIRLIMPFDFNAVNYKVSAWLDCADTAETPGTYYNTGNINEITRVDNHIIWSGEMVCGFAQADINLQEYKDQWNAKVVIPLTLTSPIGRFEFCATDFSEFYAHVQDAIGKGETYSICLSFECRIAYIFNVGRSEPSNYHQSPEYYFQFPEQPPSDGKIISGSVFVGESAQTVATRVLVFNSARMIVSRSQPIEFPIERGKLTTITGEMLTDYYTGSFNINNIWDGEIIIEL